MKQFYLFAIILALIVLIICISQSKCKSKEGMDFTTDHHICITCLPGGSFTCSPAITHPDGTPYCLDPSAVLSTSFQGCTVEASSQVCKLN